MDQGPSFKNREHVPKYTLISTEEDPRSARFNKPLPWFSCGIGWFSFLLGFPIPLFWYYATFLYFFKYYDRDPRERAGLAASAIAALGFSVAVSIALITILCTK